MNAQLAENLKNSGVRVRNSKNFYSDPIATTERTYDWAI